MCVCVCASKYELGGQINGDVKCSFVRVFRDMAAEEPQIDLRPIHGLVPPSFAAIASAKYFLTLIVYRGLWNLNSD